MRGQNLDVDPVESLPTQMLKEGEQQEFRRICLQVKHAFGGKSPVDVHAVKPCHKLVAIPCFRTMSCAQCVEGLIAGYHSGGDPGAVLAWPGNLSTVPDHL
ncbi:MAG: hypothetical protein A2X94_13265 [Bdellovibrionales bacterium GWB1_55_8]|nr:MAG: hypothetical protein A2X94_13265 [Bdellovibrionales bacterium GWB1_55_8]